MIHYFLNWMGPINNDWIEKNGECQASGRIDISNIPDEPFGLEYAVPPMHKEDWGKFSEWLRHHYTPEVWSYDELIQCFEDKQLKRKIRWLSNKKD